MSNGKRDRLRKTRFISSAKKLTAAKAWFSLHIGWSLCVDNGVFREIRTIRASNDDGGGKEEYALTRGVTNTTTVNTVYKCFLFLLRSTGKNISSTTMFSSCTRWSAGRFDKKNRLGEKQAGVWKGSVLGLRLDQSGRQRRGPWARTRANARLNNSQIKKNISGSLRRVTTIVRREQKERERVRVRARRSEWLNWPCVNPTLGQRCNYPFYLYPL